MARGVVSLHIRSNSPFEKIPMLWSRFVRDATVAFWRARCAPVSGSKRIRAMLRPSGSRPWFALRRGARPSSRRRRGEFSEKPGAVIPP